jgi:Zn-dependent alcohol dehydrogenase
VPGHEATGVVAQTGPRVTRLKVGDAVVMSIVPSCGDCPACARGRRNHCQTAGRAMSRGSLLDGSLRLSRNGEPLHHFLTVSSFAQYAVVPESGAVAIDLTEEKLGLARTFGATDVVHAGQEDPAGTIRRLMGGVDYAFEAAGREQTVQQAWSSLDVGGEAVVVGLMPQQATVTLSAGRFVNEQVIRGCYFGSAHLQRDVPALAGHYLAGNLLLDELITRRIGLEELNDAFDALRMGKGARSVLVLE